MVIEPKTNRIYVYNSIHQKQAIGTSALKELLEICNGNNEIKIVKMPSSMQRDGSSCGLYTIINALALMKRQTPPTNMTDTLARNLRTVLAEYIWRMAHHTEK